MSMPRWSRFADTGWALFIVFALAIAISHGTAQLATVVVFVGIGSAMTGWIVRRPGRGAFVTSLVLGVLHTVEQSAYLAADFGKHPVSASMVGADTEGLIAGLLIVVGSVGCLRASRRNREMVPSAV